MSWCHSFPLYILIYSENRTVATNVSEEHFCIWKVLLRPNHRRVREGHLEHRNNTEQASSTVREPSEGTGSCRGGRRLASISWTGSLPQALEKHNNKRSTSHPLCSVTEFESGSFLCIYWRHQVSPAELHRNIVNQL